MESAEWIRPTLSTNQGPQKIGALSFVLSYSDWSGRSLRGVALIYIGETSGSILGLRLQHYISMIPLFNPMVTAWVRSLAPSLDKMLRMWAFTVCSEMERLSAIILLAFPAATSRKISISRLVNASSA